MTYRLPCSIVVLFAVLGLACEAGKEGESETESSSGSTSGSTATDGGSTGLGGSSATTMPASTGADGSSSEGAEPAEYEGLYSSGFGFSYFTACGEAEPWYAAGVPAYEVCAADLYLHVVGVLQPSTDGDPTPTLEVMEILEGPCAMGSCDGSVAAGGCGTFDELCAESVIECDPLAQDCPPDEKCMPWANDGGDVLNATRCSIVVGMGAPGEACTVEGGPQSGIDDCEIGAVCWDVDPATNEGQCTSICDASLMPDPVCVGGTSCMPVFPPGQEPAGLQNVGVCA